MNLQSMFRDFNPGLEGQSYIQYRALLISLGLHLFLLMFEVLAADKLENHRHAWVSVFAPLILISIVSIAACIWAVKHDRSFEITLASKLNGNTSATYTSVVSPLYISYTTLILMSFTTKRANQWWFGLRKDVCQFLLGVCPLLQEYANISYSLPQDSRPSRTPQAAEAGLASGDNKRDGATSSRRLEHRVVVPALSLEVPD
ncbi:hypothetical protein Pmani_039084 [Petrolisthes manimaculis]|uniref:Uncharacterized protein n=1 Tax=Petrolisthes manimaculis TaxID=1843537 RepID=A0AAE1NDH5_9EUCA|nr:hypothetical protein Pmani_039084 [Petrolisthes manimaculis]